MPATSPHPIRHIQGQPGALKLPPLSLAAQYGDLLFVSGTPGFDAEAQLTPDFQTQFELAVKNLAEILQRGGSDLRDILKVNMLLVRSEDMALMNSLYAAAFGPEPFPARTTCVVQALPDPRMLLEIECVAVVAR